MTIFDQFDTSLTVFYSGSYLDDVILGDNLTAVNDGIFNKRVLVASRIDQNTVVKPGVFNVMADGTWPVWLMWNHVSGTYNGRVQKFVRHKNSSEIVFDSLVPNPIEIHFRSATELLWYPPIYSVTGSERWGINSGDPGSQDSLSGSLFHLWAAEPGNVASTINDAAIDHEWHLRFPYESKYKGLMRLTKFDGKFSTRYTATRGASDGLTMATPSSSNILGVAAMGVVGAAEYIPINGLMHKPGNSFPYYNINSDVIGTIPPIVYYQMFFGIGNGAPGGSNGGSSLYRKGPSYVGRRVTDTTIFPAFVPLIRGFKYGLYNIEPSRTSCVYRANRYGQIRDMLEQRLVTKFLDKAGRNTTTLGPVRIQFVSGTQIYPNTVDYLSATNPSYNLTDSGIYDKEYRSGQPFFDDR